MNTTATARIQKELRNEQHNLQAAKLAGHKAPLTEIKIHIFTWALDATMSEIEAVIEDELAELNQMVTRATAREITQQATLVQALRTAQTIRTYA